MVYLENNSTNTLNLNINTSSRDVVTTYSVILVHNLSQDSTTFSVDTSNPSEYADNDRYCELVITLSLKYEGEYKMTILSNENDIVYKGIAIVGSEVNGFITYTSDNEDNSNYIYIN